MYDRLRTLEIHHIPRLRTHWIVSRSISQPSSLAAYAIFSATTALSISVIAHPTLTARIVFLAVFTTVGEILCLLPFPGVRRVSIRFASASAGSFGLVVCIAIMARNASWGNVWERAWLRDGDNWGTRSEKGLSAAYCLLLCAGFISDTLLHRKFGENPDEVNNNFLPICKSNPSVEMGPLSCQDFRQSTERCQPCRNIHSLRIMVRPHSRAK